MKKYIFVLLTLLFFFASCSEDNPWSPEDDINDYLAKNPYGVSFTNKTDGDLFIKCDDLSANVIIVKTTETSESYHCSKSGITIKYSGQGTYWTEKIKYIGLEKDKVINVSITYP